MLARRPYGGQDALVTAAREEWFALTPGEWRHAFGHHPQIGHREDLRRRFASTRHLSAQEQAGVHGAPDALLDALADGNRAYFEKFGYIFIVRAAGRSAEDILRILRERMTNDPGTELRVAAEEHAAITELRLLAIQ